MNHLEAYIFLFNDSFVTSLMFVPRTAYAADAMLAFGIYNKYLIFILSFIASIIGLSINWIIGSFIRKLDRLEKLADRAEVLNRAENFFKEKGKWILLLSFIPFWGGLFTTAAGTLRFNFIYFLRLISISKFIALFIKIFL